MDKVAENRSCPQKRGVLWMKQCGTGKSFGKGELFTKKGDVDSVGCEL